MNRILQIYTNELSVIYMSPKWGILSSSILNQYSITCTLESNSNSEYSNSIEMLKLKIIQSLENYIKLQMLHKNAQTIALNAKSKSMPTNYLILAADWR